MRQNRRQRQAYLFILPATLLVGVGFLTALLYIVYYSLQHYNANKPWANGFAGLSNFVKLFTQDTIFASSLGFSVKWVVTQVALQLFFGLLLALVLNQKFRGRGIARTLVFAPWAISGVITAVLWGLMLNEHIGVINDLFKRLHLIESNIGWLGDRATVFGSVVVAELWRGIPFFAIMLLAGLQAIPGELYESAQLDGAGRVKRFTNITMPYLKNSIVLSTLLRAVWEFNNVDIIFNLTAGGPSRQTLTTAMYVVNQSIKASDFGYGSAIALVGFVLLLCFSLLYLKISRFGKEE